VFGGVTAQPSSAFLDGTDPVTVDTCNDLWHWNGDLMRPAWTEHGQQRRQATLWPPRWAAALGWASDADGGELWLVGDSGAVSVRDESSYAYGQFGGSNGVWRFSMLTGAWDRYQLGKAEAAGLWPAPRESASLSSGGWMFGGSSIYGDSTWGPVRTPGSTECVGDVSSPLPSATHRLLSGLWRWQDSADTVFYE